MVVVVVVVRGDSGIVERSTSIDCAGTGSSSSGSERK